MALTASVSLLEWTAHFIQQCGKHTKVENVLEFTGYGIFCVVCMQYIVLFHLNLSSSFSNISRGKMVHLCFLSALFVQKTGDKIWMTIN